MSCGWPASASGRSRRPGTSSSADAPLRASVWTRSRASAGVGGDDRERARRHDHEVAGLEHVEGRDACPQDPDPAEPRRPRAVRHRRADRGRTRQDGLEQVVEGGHGPVSRRRSGKGWTGSTGSTAGLPTSLAGSQRGRRAAARTPRSRRRSGPRGRTRCSRPSGSEPAPHPPAGHPERDQRARRSGSPNAVHTIRGPGSRLAIRSVNSPNPRSSTEKSVPSRGRGLADGQRERLETDDHAACRRGSTPTAVNGSTSSTPVPVLEPPEQQLEARPRGPGRRTRRTASRPPASVIGIGPVHSGRPSVVADHDVRRRPEPVLVERVAADRRAGR